MDAKEMKQIETMLSRAVGLIAEDAQHKFDILAEGHKMLAEKIDRVESALSNKIDAVATDLTAHRCDTEAHQKGWQVCEE